MKKNIYLSKNELQTGLALLHLITKNFRIINFKDMQTKIFLELSIHFLHYV